jgi:hypothetical protein
MTCSALLSALLKRTAASICHPSVDGKRAEDKASALRLSGPDVLKLYATRPAGRSYRAKALHRSNRRLESLPARSLRGCRCRARNDRGRRDLLHRLGHAFVDTREIVCMTREIELIRDLGAQFAGRSTKPLAGGACSLGRRQIEARDRHFCATRDGGVDLRACQGVCGTHDAEGKKGSAANNRF